MILSQSHGGHRHHDHPAVKSPCRKAHSVAAVRFRKPNKMAFKTQYEDVNHSLEVLLSGVTKTLHGLFTGMYLYGSLATGDFDPQRSDIDFLVVTSSVLPDKMIFRLKTTHRRLFESSLKWGKKLEGAYIPVDAVRKFSESGPVCPLVNKDQFLVARPEAHWVINRHIVRTYNAVIAGPSARDLIDQVQPEDIRDAVRKLLHNNWTPFLQDAGLFLPLDYAQPFVVLTMCRAWYTIEHGDVASKRRSAEWVLENSDAGWSQLVTEALRWRDGDKPGSIEQTQRFMRYVFGRVGMQV